MLLVDVLPVIQLTVKDIYVCASMCKYCEFIYLKFLRLFLSSSEAVCYQIDLTGWLLAG